MSMQATETRPGKSNIFTNKIGPLPMWIWLMIATVILLGWAYLKNRNKPAASTSTTADASQVPQFVNQTYTTVQPPSSPVPPTVTDTDEDEGGKKPKKKPVRRKHPTHPTSGQGGGTLEPEDGGGGGTGTVTKIARPPVRRHRGPPVARRPMRPHGGPTVG